MAPNLHTDNINWKNFQIILIVTKPFVNDKNLNKCSF